jgi:hypothetical protein
MQTAKELLVELTRCGVYLQIQDGSIRYSAPEDAFTDEISSSLSSLKPEILSLYSGFPIINAYSLIRDVWDLDIESRGEGKAAYDWIEESAHWQIISAAEDEVNRIGKHGDPSELNAAWSVWVAAWGDAIAAWVAQSKKDLDKR